MNSSHQDLIKLATIPMPFGKHKGTLLINLPEHYVSWFYGKGLPEGEIGRLLGLLYEIKLNGLEYLVHSISEKIDNRL